MTENASIFTNSDQNGAFTLDNLPSGQDFSGKLTTAGYVPTYTKNFNMTTSFSTSGAYTLYTASELSGWGITQGQAVIRGRVSVSGSPSSYIGGAAVTCTSSLHPGPCPYQVTYMDDQNSLGGTSTYSNGKFLVLSVDAGDTVTVTASKQGWSFGQTVLFTHADSVSQGGISGTQLATGSIQGTISYGGSTTGTVYVGLFTNPVVTPQSSPAYMTTLPSPGAYQFYSIPDGTYYVGAIITQNIMAVGMTDPYGMYNIVMPGQSPTPVTITGGNSQSGISFTLFDGTSEYPNPFYVAPITPTKIGIFDHGTWYLDSNQSWAWDGPPADTLGEFGIRLDGAIPVVGDWNGDGTTKIAVFMDNIYYLDVNRNWQWDGEPTDKMGVFGVGLTGAVPVVGDGNGDGISEIGIYQDGIWYLDKNRSWQWDGEPTDTMGVFGVGLTNEVPVVGDWNADGTSEIGIYQEGLWYLDKNRSWQWDGEPTDQYGVFGVGLTGVVPVPGKW